MNTEIQAAIGRNPELLITLQLGAVSVLKRVKDDESLDFLLSPTMTEGSLIKTAIEFLPESQDKTPLVDRLSILGFK